MSARLLAALFAGALALPSFAGERAFVEVEATPDACFVGEPVRITLRFGFDAELEVIQAYRRELGVPARVEAPWLEALPGAIALGDAPRTGETFALNDDPAFASPAADRSLDGRRYVVWEHARTFRPTRAGSLELSPALLQYTFATRFADDFVNGRTALDPQAAQALGRPLTITVKPLPEDGRPAAFTGGVGRFTVTAAAEPTDVAVGESLELTLSVTGEGNLTDLDLPLLDDLPGFHRYGALGAQVTRSRGTLVRTSVYDLAPQSPDVTEIPAIAFAYFDPSPPAGYRTVHTEPIPIEVRPRRGGGLGGQDDGDAPPSNPASGRRTYWGEFWLAVLGAIACLFLLVRLRRRRAAPGATPALDAAGAFHATVDGNADLADTVAAYLAARLDCPMAAVIDPGLPDRLSAAGIPADLAARSAALLEDLVGARYGGSTSRDRRGEARALVDDLERHWRSAAEPGPPRAGRAQRSVNPNGD